MIIQGDTIKSSSTGIDKAIEMGAGDQAVKVLGELKVRGVDLGRSQVAVGPGPPSLVVNFKVDKNNVDEDVALVISGGNKYAEIEPIDFTNEAFDDGNDFSLVTDKFTVPTTGDYHFNASIKMIVLNVSDIPVQEVNAVLYITVSIFDANSIRQKVVLNAFNFNGTDANGIIELSINGSLHLDAGWKALLRTNLSRILEASTATKVRIAGDITKTFFEGIAL